MRALLAHHGRVSLLATLLILPLLHGAGAHLAAGPVDGPGVRAPLDGTDGHASDEPCALCVASRTTGERAVGPSDAPRPPAAAAAHLHSPFEPVTGLARSRPDAARAPPQHSA